jgi:hypothetical protein
LLDRWPARRGCRPFPFLSVAALSGHPKPPPVSPAQPSPAPPVSRSNLGRGRHCCPCATTAIHPCRHRFGPCNLSATLTARVRRRPGHPEPCNPAQDLLPRAPPISVRAPPPPSSQTPLHSPPADLNPSVSFPFALWSFCAGYCSVWRSVALRTQAHRRVRRPSPPCGRHCRFGRFCSP